MQLYTPSKKATVNRNLRMPRADTSKVPVPQEFADDLHMLCRSPAEVSKVCGVTGAQARRLLAGSSVPADILEKAQACFYADRELSVGSQLRSIMARKPERDKVIGLLQQAAMFVQAFRNELKIPEDQRPLYILPPRDTLLRLVLTCEECFNLLVELHAQCPEVDRLVFQRAEDLRDVVHKVSQMRRAAYENSLVHRGQLHQMQGSGETADKTDDTLREAGSEVSFTEAE